MARRGIPFEDRERQFITVSGSITSAQDFDARAAHTLPTGGVGLLFMAYNYSIANQFKFTQQSWANNPGFPDPFRDQNIGIDPVIGQVGADMNLGAQKLPTQWDDPNAEKVSCPFAGFVTMKGGEYFFSPSLTFLRNLL
jgi:hypothetical protein